MIRFATLLGLALAALAVAGCGTDDGDDAGGAPAAGPDALLGTPWVLVPGGDEWQGTGLPGIEFGGDGRASGSAGCNRYGGDYTVDGDALDIGEIASTRMACAPPAMEAEQRFLAALGEVARWRVEGDRLTLDDAAGEELLTFRPASPVGDWRATSLRQGDAVSTLLAGTTITAAFGEDGTLSGSAGCNDYGGEYEVARGRLTLREVAATEMACPRPAGIMEQEQDFLTGLADVASFQVDGAGLTLLTAEGTIVATFEPVR